MDQTLNIMQEKLIQFAKCTFSLLVIAGLTSGDPPDSPCPELFQYKFDGSDWIGLIELNNIKVNQTVINIIVELSLPTSLPSPYKGRLDLLEGQQQAAQAVFQNRPLFYRITFPLRNPIPRITEIVVDNAKLCNGPQGDVGKEFQCPSKDGQYEDPVQCDKFFECVDGVAKSVLCPDGLVFDPLNKKINKCDQPFNVHCGDRIELQPPQSNALCPRRNGFFAHTDPSVCNIFYSCIQGKADEIRCINGLHFDEYSGTCVWPESAGRQGCAPESKKSSDGFSCPKDSQTDSSGRAVTHPKFANPTDCQKFYVCLNGVEPRELSCRIGEVYNVESQRCDTPENVSGCEDWYIEADEKKQVQAR